MSGDNPMTGTASAGEKEHLLKEDPSEPKTLNAKHVTDSATHKNHFTRVASMSHGHKKFEKQSEILNDHEQLDAFMQRTDTGQLPGGDWSEMTAAGTQSKNRGCDHYCRCCAASNCCMKYPAAGFFQVLKYAQSGDIVLFDNKCNLGTCIISCFTRSDFDHVGMIFRKPGSTKPSDVYIIESLSPKVEIAYLSEIMDIVRRVDGEGVMFWRPLKHPDMSDPTNFPNGKIAPELEKKMFELAVQFQGVSYERVPGSMVSATCSQDAVFWNSLFGEGCCRSCADLEKYSETKDKENSESVFCSELVARLYNQAGILQMEGKEVQSDRFLPKDFSADPHAILKDFINPDYSVAETFKIVQQLKDDYTFDASGANKVEGNKASVDEDAKGEGGGERNTFIT